MRIDPMRVSQAGPLERTGEPREAIPRRSQRAPSDTTDLLAISAGISVSQTRETMLDELREAYLSGALQPDPARIAENLMKWGFDPGREAAL